MLPIRSPAQEAESSISLWWGRDGVFRMILKTHVGSEDEPDGGAQGDAQNMQMWNGSSPGSLTSRQVPPRKAVSGDLLLRKGGWDFPQLPGEVAAHFWGRSESGVGQRCVPPFWSLAVV